jgi:hypothetical protein
MAMMVVGDGFALFPAVYRNISADADGFRAAPHPDFAS